MSLQWKMSSPIGAIYLVASEQGLQTISWEKKPVPMTAKLDAKSPEARVLAQAVEELEEYFRGERKDFTVSLDAHGTPFQDRVWSELKKIPYGKTCSYGDIATRIKRKGAMRAVGTANGRNPLPIVVPCHRVIAANQKLGGYTGGTQIKKKLLAIEGLKQFV